MTKPVHHALLDDSRPLFRITERGQAIPFGTVVQANGLVAVDQKTGQLMLCFWTPGKDEHEMRAQSVDGIEPVNDAGRRMWQKLNDRTRIW